MMIKACELNMTNGEHPASDYLTWENRDQFDSIAKLAYRSVLIIEPDDSVYGRTGADAKHPFYAYMLNRSRVEYNYRYTYGPFEPFAPHMAATYNSMLMLAEVVEELRTSGLEKIWQSGKQLAKLFMNRTFVNDLGEIYMDPTGQREPTININQLDWNTSQIRTVLVQRAGSSKLEIAQKLQWPGVWPPVTEPKCGFRGDASVCNSQDNMSTIAVSVTTVVLVVVSLMTLLRGYVKYGSLLLEFSWEIPSDQLQPNENSSKKQDKVLLYTKELRMVYLVPLEKRPSVILASKQHSHQVQFSEPGLRILREVMKVDHPNINRLNGITIMQMSGYFVSDYCTRGSLPALLNKMTLDANFQASLMLDVLKGLRAVHRSVLKCHGNLSAYSCLIDRNFTLKLGKVGFAQIRLQHVHDISQKGTQNEKGKQAFASGAKKDVRDIAHIMLQIIFQDNAKECVLNSEPVNDFTAQRAGALTGPFANLLPLLISCQSIDMSNLPDIDQLLKNVQPALRPFTKAASLAEQILGRLATYTDELDYQVAQRTIDLMEERKRCDNLLWAMLPSDVVNDLRKGHTPEAEYYLSTSIMFVEVSGFGILLGQITPEEAMVFLNEVFSKFDGLLNNHDVYKVETIKESYLVASGVPRRNESRHVYEVCRLAASMVNAYLATFALRFNGTTTLRAGIHSGAVAAGAVAAGAVVVGRKAPRYFLFGDTINTASRMMSTGADGRIHISHSTADQLKDYSEFVAEPRGVIEVKGKGMLPTYWLCTVTTANCST
ncbi:atrial natriuretic peptide receptor 1-like [Paramacrobiotus metropolitanus]|uniref:atrial natriuretic peptide receptor 1-like n=1 Tax=Paramacrobiotus metropolitanus TaxID=2943436 RepID=UPI002445FB6D|nr:atrial natriuretic peptide receptor 1-like [Paramacrobiotus metropolitanus]